MLIAHKGRALTVPRIEKQRDALAEALQGLYTLIPIEIPENDRRLVAARAALAAAGLNGGQQL